MAKTRKRNSKTHKKIKKVCKFICDKTKKNLGRFIPDKKYLNKLNKRCNKTCVKKFTKKMRKKHQSGGAVTGVLPSIFTNLFDGVSHSFMSNFDILNGYPVTDSPLPFLAHYKPLL